MIYNKILSNSNSYIGIRSSFAYILLILSWLFMTINSAQSSVVESGAVSISGQVSTAHFSISATADNGTNNSSIFNPLHKIDIIGNLDVPSEQVGKDVSIYLVAKYQDNWYMKTSSNVWDSWDFNISNLVPYIDKLKLKATQQGFIHNQLTGLLGNFQVYVGYKIDNEVYYNSNPLIFSVANTSSVQTIQILEEQGQIPKLDRSTEIQGLDTNTNGIRDDVDKYIATNYPLASEQTAVQQFARTMQRAILVDISNLTDVKAVAVKASRAVNCIYSRFDSNSGSKQPSEVIAELESISSNTKSRLLAYLAFSKALDGTVGSLPEGDTCE